MNEVRGRGGCRGRGGERRGEARGEEKTFCSPSLFEFEPMSRYRVLGYSAEEHIAVAKLSEQFIGEDG
jgi:hypothetical protein